MSNGNLPDVPSSWIEALKQVAIIATLIASVAATSISACNQQKLQMVQSHQEANSVKLDDANVKIDQAKEEAAKSKQAAEAVKSKLDK